MSIERDGGRNVFSNRNPLYQKILKNRNKSFIVQYGTKRFYYPTTKEMARFTIINHLWTVGDKYWKLAEAHYGDPAAAWVIGWFNQKPTESHVKTGDMILIPLPLEDVYSFLGI